MKRKKYVLTREAREKAQADVNDGKPGTWTLETVELFQIGDAWFGIHSGDVGVFVEWANQVCEHDIRYPHYIYDGDPTLGGGVINDPDRVVFCLGPDRGPVPAPPIEDSVEWEYRMVDEPDTDQG